MLPNAIELLYFTIRLAGYNKTYMADVAFVFFCLLISHWVVETVQADTVTNDK